ncbi:MAG: glycosyltransferase family 4 protein [Candidatus Auribacterota bacterium]|nr:glycosyltransferase family 4 protein [Candidatus Auribacterota bacterium]
MKKQRYCFITTFYPPFHPGGCGLHVYHLANLLARDGHSVDVICSGDAHAYKLSDQREGDYPHHPGVTVHRVKSKAGRLEPLLTYLSGGPFFSRARIRAVLAKGFDVIHYHNISLFGGIRSLSLGDGLKLFTQHTYWLFCPTHYLWKDNKEVCGSKSCLRCLAAYHRPPQLWRIGGLRDRMLDNINSLIMPCRYMVERHREEGFEGRMDCLPYFVDPVKSCDSPQLEREFSDLRPFFLFVARFEEYKGPRLAVETFMKKQGDSKLVMVGTGSMEEELRELAGPDPRIRFLKYVAPDKLDWLYAHAIALLAPSIWPEMGNQTVIQAQSCGTPAIASDVGLLPELVRAHKAGIMFRTGEGFLAALNRMEDPGVREEFVEPCLRAYRAEYTPEKFLERYYRLIDDLSVSRQQRS